jgi:sulfur carrier protein ThiS
VRTRENPLIITVYLHTILQKQTPDGLIRSIELSIPEGSTVSEVISQLEIHIGADNLLIAVNGQMAEESQLLFPGDRVDFMPAISGGICF